MLSTRCLRKQVEGSYVLWSTPNHVGHACRDFLGFEILLLPCFRSQVSTKDAELEESRAEHRLRKLLGVSTPASPPPDNGNDFGGANLFEEPLAECVEPDEHYYACAGEEKPNCELTSLASYSRHCG